MADCWCKSAMPVRTDDMWWGADRDGGRADADDAVKLPTDVFYVGEPQTSRGITRREIHLRTVYPSGRTICGTTTEHSFQAVKL